MAADLRDPAVFERDRILLHRYHPGYLVRVWYLAGTHVYYNRIDESGARPKGARHRSRSLTYNAERMFQLYVPCRWNLHCTAQRTTSIHFVDIGDVDACDEHAIDYRAWEAGDRRGDEPRPDCWCTDLDIDYGLTQDYCPEHGTPAERGIEFGAELGKILLLGRDPSPATTTGGRA